MAKAKEVKTAMTAPMKIEKKKNLPTVAYLVMCWQRENTMRALEAIRKDTYPNKLKTVYLFHQEPFPNPLQHNMPFVIKEFNVLHCNKADFWAFKMDTAVKVITEDVVIHRDEDDDFPVDYTEDSIAPIIAGEGDITWCLETEFVTRDQIEIREFPVGSGSLAIKTEVLKELWNEFRKQHPSTRIATQNGNFYPVDGPFFFLWRDDPRCVIRKKGIRSYHLRKGTAGSDSWNPAELLDTHPLIPLVAPEQKVMKRRRDIALDARMKAIEERRKENIRRHKELKTKG